MVAYKFKECSKASSKLKKIDDIRRILKEGISTPILTFRR